MEMSIQEQGTVIEELEEEVRRLEGVVEGIREKARNRTDPSQGVPERRSDVEAMEES